MAAETLKEKFHRTLYLTLQDLRGRRVRAYLRQLREWERLDPAAFQRVQATRLAEALRYARDHVSLYSSEPWRTALDRSGPENLLRWPVLDRATVQSHESDLLAQPRKKNLYFRRTSGSTGQALQIAMDRDSAAWGWASEYRGMLWHGVPIGAKTLMIPVRRDGAFQDWARNRTVIPASDLSRDRLAYAYRFLVEKRPTLVYGLTSAVVELARVAGKRRASGPPLVPYVTTYGEMLFPFQREEIERHLGARVIQIYGAVEFGPLGIECPAGHLHVHAASVQIEILKNGEPVEPGEEGEVVLTSVTNRAMPLIRYRIGDLGRLSPEPCPCGRPYPVLSGLQGRMGDLLRTADGGLVHGNTLGIGLKEIVAHAPAGAIRQVRFDQLSPRRWTILVAPGPGFDHHIAAQLVGNVHRSFGESCEVEVQKVDEIPREPSGKFRYYRAAPIDGAAADGPTPESQAQLGSRVPTRAP